ncbi:GIY-YIG nuclease family protein [Thiomicrorhabdus sp.]|uniref:GIY-YIG nuclease family protein n=1 Tax=Thiomicrorhabdus sp. TaxID=2039724 RepID=UPI0029C92E3B|nr:GIY-YIG nuclease family protein [Thiomicrorhabdus sp.]
MSRPDTSSEAGWQVYLLRCADHSLYCGITNRIHTRLRQHNGDLKGGARYTQSRRPCRLVYLESVDSRQKALRRELEIKGLSKPLKEALIQQTQV